MSALAEVEKERNMPNKARKGRLPGLVSRAIRVTIAGTFVVLTFGLVAIRVSIARAADLGMNFGDQLLLVGENYVSGNTDADVYHVHLNGQTIESTNFTVKRPMREVLDYAAAQCKEHAAGLGTAFQHMDKALETKEALSGGPGALILHQEYGERGYVFCVAPDHELSAAELFGRLGRVGRSGDFSTVGNMRYVAVRQLGAQARIVTAWTDGKFEFAKMFPSTGDAPGVDFGGVPRPDGARRTLSATVEGAPAGVNTYSVKGKASEVLASVNGKLVAAGWKTVPTAPGVPEAGKYYTLGAKEDLVVTAKDAPSGTTTVGYVVSRNIGSVSR